MEQIVYTQKEQNTLGVGEKSDNSPRQLVSMARTADLDCYHKLTFDHPPQVHETGQRRMETSCLGKMSKKGYFPYM